MSKSLLTAKLIGGGILGTGAVAAGGYGIVEHFRSKESTTETTATENNQQTADVGSSGSQNDPNQPAVSEGVQNTEVRLESTGDNSPSSELSEQKNGDTPSQESKDSSDSDGTPVSNPTGTDQSNSSPSPQVVNTDGNSPGSAQSGTSSPAAADGAK